MTCVSTAALAAAACLLAAGAGRADTTLTISSWAPPNHLMTREVTQAWAAEVEKVTQGRVKFRMLAKHPSAPPGAFDAVREGLVDVSYTGPNYTPARHVVTMLPELSGGGSTSLVNSWDAADRAAETLLRSKGVAISDASPALLAEIRAKSAVIEQEWIKAVAAKGVDGAQALAEFRAELKKVAAEP